MNPEQFQKLVESRNSTRDFTSKEVPSDLLDEILQEGMNAPSWSNTRPYLVAVAEGA
ncbi:MAG: nitroreductase family protein [Microbacteriaceae bacterium]|nr:nitroreductase family protein [Microbacteriaceae bacterium]